jgi:6-phosphogluconolactonase (cycloisomerase 2 family)
MHRSLTQRKAHTSLVSAIVGLVILVIGAWTPALAQEKILYTLSNNIENNQNSVVAYHRLANGELEPHPMGPFLTRGTGIDNNTNGKLGPNDNDTPLIVSPDNTWLFAVNGNSNTIAAFAIQSDGSLEHAPGSPFPSMGVGPVSLAISGDVLLVANRNEDPNQLEELRGAVLANYASFRIGTDGSLTFVSKIDLEDGQKNTQVLVSSRDGQIAFGNDFQVDVDFDDEGPVSKLFSTEPAVRGRIHSFRLGDDGALQLVDSRVLPETVDPAPDVPSIPLGIWDHPTKNLLYVGFVTRNQLGVYAYDVEGKLTFINAVPNSGQDICWIRTSADGTRLYAVNNLPRDEEQDMASTVTVFDISGDRAKEPVEIDRVQLPHPLGTFVNNRAIPQPNSTAFQLAIDNDGDFLYVVAQRIDQTGANDSDEGNIIHTVKLDPSGNLEVVASRHLGQDGVSARARPHGVVVLDL